MKKKHIPNETIYQISIPEGTIYRFQGEGRYEETLEDHLMHCIVQPLRESAIPFEFLLGAFEVVDGFGMILRVDGSRFDESSIAENIENEGLLMGLVVKRSSQEGWVVVYNDSRRSKYKK